MIGFSKLRKSRLASLLLAVAWLPCMAVCCVVSPFQGAADATFAVARPAAATAAQAADHGCKHHAGQRSADDADAKSGDDVPPAQSCCGLIGKAEVRVEKVVDTVEQPTIVTTALPARVFAVADMPVRIDAPVDVRDHGPPLYLANASFLI